MKTKTFFILIITSILMISCNVNKHYENYQDTFNTTGITNINDSLSILGQNIILDDTIVTVKYDGEEKVLNVIYNGKEHKFTNVRIEDIHYESSFGSIDGKKFYSEYNDEELLQCDHRSTEKDGLFMNMTIYWK